MNVLKNLLNSEKGVFVLALIIGATVLAALGHMTIDQWIDYTKWMATIYVAGKTVHGAASAIGGRAVDHDALADKIADRITVTDEAVDEAADKLPSEGDR